MHPATQRDNPNTSVKLYLERLFLIYFSAMAFQETVLFFKFQFFFPEQCMPSFFTISAVFRWRGRVLKTPPALSSPPPNIANHCSSLPPPVTTNALFIESGEAIAVARRKIRERTDGNEARFFHRQHNVFFSNVERNRLRSAVRKKRAEEKEPRTIEIHIYIRTCPAGRFSGTSLLRGSASIFFLHREQSERRFSASLLR